MTILVAYAHGATFGRLTIETAAILALTLGSFCLIAMALALVVTKPEQMTTIAIVTVLMAYFVTGFNGSSPEMLADGAEMVNYLPNSLATRMQIAHWVGTGTYESMAPPEAPDSIEYVGTLIGYAAASLAASIVIVRRIAYGGGRR